MQNHFLKLEQITPSRSNVSLDSSRHKPLRTFLTSR